MESTTIISISAVTHIGAACSVNDDRIYANGKFLYPSVADYAQISLEARESKCLFALADGMEDEYSGISITEDLKKFHQKAQNSSKDIHVKLDDMVQCVEQASNLLHSVSLGDSDFRERRTAFAAVLIDEGKVAAVNLGSCRVYKLEGDTFKLIVNDYKRAERLLKMGIISSEQAEMLSGQQKASMEEGRSTVKKSDVDTLREGTVYLLCSSGLTAAVSDDAIYDIMASSKYPDEAAGLLVAEAVKNEGEDNITAMVIKIEETDVIPAQQPVSRASQFRAVGKGNISASKGKLSKPSRVRTVDVGSIVSMAVLIVLIAAVFFGGFKIWSKLRNPDALDTSSSKGAQTNTAESSTGLPGIEIEKTTEPESEGAITDGPAAPEPGNKPAAEPKASELVGPEGAIHIVKAGDMLMKISKKYYGTESKYKLIMDANKITDPDKIMVGDKLIIPPLK